VVGPRRHPPVAPLVVGQHAHGLPRPEDPVPGPEPAASDGDLDPTREVVNVELVGPPVPVPW